MESSLTRTTKSTLMLLCILISPLVSGINKCMAQAGISASPSRLYFQPGQPVSQKLTLTNPNKDRALEIGISLNDWNYDSLGNNLTYDPGTLNTSCAADIKVLPGTYFTLAAGATKEITIAVSPEAMKANNTPVRTAMVYITQLNPGDAKAENGAAIKVTVRMGVKVYLSTSANAAPDLDITNFVLSRTNSTANALSLYVHNTGNLWLEGKVRYELLHKQNGKKIKLEGEEFYSLPGDNRIFKVGLPQGLESGAYTATAIINFGQDEGLKLAELDMTL